LTSFLLGIGKAAGSLLPDLFFALSSGAAVPPEQLNVFSLLPGQETCEEAAALAADLSACSRLMAGSGEKAPFACGFTFSSCNPVFRPVSDLYEDADVAALVAALRGKGLPLSCQTDREAVEWCFTDLLARPDDPSVKLFVSWLDGIRDASRDQTPVRLACMADLTDPFSAGILFALLHDFSERFENRPVSVFLIALAETSSPLPDSFFPALAASLESIDSRSLLRLSAEDAAAGLDAAWMLSLPSSMVESPDSLRFTAFSAAQVLSQIYRDGEHPGFGLHIPETDGTFSPHALGGQAASFAAHMGLYTWLLTDLLPALRHYQSHPARFRSLALNPRTALFRQVFPAGVPAGSLSDEISLLDRTAGKLVSAFLRFFRTIPSHLRFPDENSAAWEQAVNACGRYITVISEYDISSSEAHESGLDAVRPVHRVSMADTDEEQLLRRLEEIRLQAENEKKARDELLSALGGFRSFQVRYDCLKRCRAALSDAQAKMAGLSGDQDRLALLKLERRIRLLKAAVARCESELAPDAVMESISALPKRMGNTDDPYAGTFVQPESCRFLESFLDVERNEPASRVPSLFAGLQEPDLKACYKEMQVLCKNAEGVPPLPLLLSCALQVCSGKVPPEFGAAAAGTLPALPLLPDLLPDAAPSCMKDLAALVPRAGAGTDTAEQRGLLAMLLLRQYRRRSSGEAALSVAACSSGNAPVLRYWLASRHTDRAFILSLEKDGDSSPFALVIPGRSFIPARRTAAQGSLVPAFATWFDPESNTFADPCSCLGEGDRKLLSQCLSGYIKALSGSGGSLPFILFLESFLQDLASESSRRTQDSHLKTRLSAACSLSRLPAYASGISVVTCAYEHFLEEDSFGSCLTGTDAFPPAACTDIPQEVLYLYRGIAFAREDSALLLGSPHARGEDYTLKRLAEECSLLSRSSDDYRDLLLGQLRALMDKYPDIVPEAREAAESLLLEAAKPVEPREPVFTWPWDPESPSMLTVFRECLGDILPGYVIAPFSDRLALFPARGNDVIGDALLSSMCTLRPTETAASESAEIVQDAVLPPLSAKFGRALCTLPEGRTLLREGLLQFEYTGEGSCKVTLTLDGAFPVRLVRVYAPEEILHLYAHDIPTVAVWPSVPFPPGEWNAYYVYAHLSEPYSASVLPENGSFGELLQTSGGRYAAVFDAFPVCIALSHGQESVGIIPNVLPKPIPEESAPVEICVDFGSAGTSVVFSADRKRRPMHGPVMVRTLLNNPAASRDLLRREFLPAVPVSALLPTVSRIFRNVPGAAPVPFMDGIILMSSDIKDLLATPSDTVYISLKWEEEKGRSGFLCLHQVLLMAALQARCEGAASVSWRFSLPDEMAKEGRESLMGLFLSLCGSVMQESGYPVPPEGLPVSFASESSAIGAYFRYCAPEDTRGGFMTLDLGACTADISLFLRGREQAARTCQIPLGVHYMLIPSLLRDPDLFSRELGFWPDEVFRKDLALLTQSLHAARTDTAALRCTRVSLDYFIADHLPVIMQCILQMYSAGTPSRTGALVLLHFSYLMMLSGLVLLQLAVDPSRNDFLPEQMALCLAGRGASLMEALPAPVKTSLWHFLSMFRNKRVASLSLLFSAEKKMEIPVGLSMLQEIYHMLPPASAVPASISVRPAELLPEFLLRFRREFPASSELLFPGFFTDNYYQPFSETGESVVAASIDQSFQPSETPRPYDSLSAWIGNLLDLVHQLHG